MSDIGSINHPTYKLHDVVQLVPVEAMIVAIKLAGDRHGGQHVKYTLMMPDGQTAENVDEISIDFLKERETEIQAKQRAEEKAQYQAEQRAYAAAAAAEQGLTPPPTLSVVEGGERRQGQAEGYQGPFRRGSDEQAIPGRADADLVFDSPADRTAATMAGDDQNGQ